MYTVVAIEIFLLRKNIQDVCRPLGDCQTADWLLYSIICGEDKTYVSFIPEGFSAWLDRNFFNLFGQSEMR